MGVEMSAQQQQKVGLTRFRLTAAQEKKLASAGARGVYTDNTVLKTAGIPAEPPSITVAGITFYRGVYILGGPTGAGKSVVLTSLIGACNRQGIPASYLYVFEPRAEVVINPRVSAQSEGHKLFEDPLMFIPNLDAGLESTRTKAKITAMLGVDSVTTPMKAYAGTSKAFSGQSTFTGGQQPSDRAFLNRLSILAKEHNLVLIVSINSVLVPYVDLLEGAVEGILAPSGISRVNVSDRGRTSERKAIPYDLPDEDVLNALTAWGFKGPIRKAAAQISKRNVFGLPPSTPSPSSLLS